jgi:hypothetical protein
MKKIVSWVLGLSAGVALGTLIIAFFVPTTSQEIRRRLRKGYQDALDVARQAQEQRRVELEQQLATMQKRRLDHKS